MTLVAVGGLTTHQMEEPMRNPNSKAAADNGLPYMQIERPADPVDAIHAIDVWARYLHHWGVRVNQEFHHMQAYANGITAAAVPTTHLDPPPEPFTN
jgi:hypothetical protein